jgi:C-terminal peptidase prc
VGSVIIVSISLGFLGGHFKVLDYRDDELDLVSAQENLIEFWRETEFSISQAQHFIDFNQCEREEKSQRIDRACKMALFKLRQICSPSDQEKHPWLGIEKLELFYVENQIGSQPDIPKVNNQSERLYKDKFREVLEACDSRQKSYALAMAVNSYLSISKDPHSYLMPIKYFDEVISKSDVRTNLFGFLVRRNRDLNWVVTKVSPGSAAYLSGLQAGDKILEVQDHLISDLGPKQILDFLNIKQNLNLVIERTFSGHTRRLFRLQLKPTDFKVTNVTWDWAHFEKKVGLIRIEKFSRNTCDDFKKALHLLKAEDLKGLVLDLRDNPGGSVDEAACVMDALVPKGELLFYTFDQKDNSTDSYYSRYQPIFNGGIAILMNQGSASASEIVAGGLKALKRAFVVGQVSFGKGTYQDGIILNNLPSVAYFETRGFYLFADGTTSQLRGVEPHIEVQPNPNLTQLFREEDLYVYPLQANLDQISNQTQQERGQKELNLMVHFDILKSDSGCLEVNQKSSDEIEKAVAVVSCQMR